MTTGTVGKDAGSVLLNLAVSQSGKSAAGADGFQKVWSSQMNKDSMGSAVRDNAADAKGKQAVAPSQVRRGDSLKAKDVRATQADGQTMQEMSPEELEQVAAVIQNAAGEMMQQIADVFGVSVEEIQAAMEELGMEETDILEVSGLNNLLLKLGNARDSYALITDGELYGNYRALMEGLNNTLQECAGELDMDARQLTRLLEEGLGREIPADENLTAEETEGIAPVQSFVEKPDDPDSRAEEGIVLTGEAVTISDAATEALQKGQDAQGNADGGAKEGGRGADKSSHRERTDVAFGQEFRTEQFQPDIQQTQAMPRGGGWDAQTRDIMNQIMDYMRLRLNGDSSNLEMQLHPASLGTLQIQIASKGGVVTANFITQNEAVKSALESQMVELRERFEEQGVKIEAIEVTVQTHEFERNLEQGRGRERQESERRSRARRIQLNDSLSMEDMEEEDALRADLLAAEGRTVDYTA